MITIIIQEFYRTITPNKPILAIDYGEKKIGLAISTPDHKISLPLKTLSDGKENEKITDIISICVKNNISNIVIGLPMKLSGDIDEQGEKIQKFTEKLDSRAKLNIYYQDERYTTRAADNLLKIRDLKRNSRNNIDDAYAAQQILDTVLLSISKL